jgi:hypothetical protein
MIHRRSLSGTSTFQDYDRLICTSETGSMNVKTNQVRHGGLRGFAHLIEEIRTHLPTTADEKSGCSHMPAVSGVAVGEASKRPLVVVTRVR